MAARFKRILLKLSGEILAGEGGHGIDETVMGTLADEIRDVAALGVQVGIVTGGGNIYRGIAASTRGMDRVGADYMGMLATVINSLALQHALENRGCYTRVMSAIEMARVCEPYIRRRAAIDHTNLKGAGWHPIPAHPPNATAESRPDWHEKRW